MAYHFLWFICYNQIVINYSSRDRWRAARKILSVYWKLMFRGSWEGWNRSANRKRYIMRMERWPFRTITISPMWSNWTIQITTLSSFPRDSKSSSSTINQKSLQLPPNGKDSRGSGAAVFQCITNCTAAIFSAWLASVDAFKTQI